MEFSLLYAIPRTTVLDSFFLTVTNIAGSHGQLWVIAAAAMIAFSRMYLFLHFPTDVLFGIAPGIALGALANWIIGRITLPDAIRS